MNQNHLQVVNLQVENYSCEILAGYGAALNSYKFRDTEFVEGYQKPEEIANQKYKGVILAPFPNRVAQGRYSFQDKNYKLNINRKKEGLALHGLLYNEVFEIISQSDQELRMKYLYTSMKEGFPFLFSLNVSYKLRLDGSLSVTTEVENFGPNMPFGLGWHPYFKLGKSIDSLKLEIPACEKLELDNALIPTGDMISFHTRTKQIKLADYHFDDCFLVNESARNSFKIIGSEHSLEVRSEQKGEFDYFQLYTPKSRSSIAIEPMSCAPDSFNNQMGLITLKPRETRSFSYEIHGKSIQ